MSRILIGFITIMRLICYLLTPILLLWLISSWQNASEIGTQEKIAFWIIYLISFSILYVVLQLVSIPIVMFYTTKLKKKKRRFDTTQYEIDENLTSISPFVVALVLSFNFFFFNGSMFHQFNLIEIPYSNLILTDYGWAIVNLFLPLYTWVFDKLFPF